MNLSNDVLTLLIKIGVSFEVIAAIFSSIFYSKYKNISVLKYFTFLLWYIVVNELIGLYIRLYSEYNSAIIHNIYHLVNFTYIHILLKSYLKNKKNKKIVISFLLLYWIILFINAFNENYLIDFQRAPYIVGALGVVIGILLYFREVLNSEEVLNVKRNLIFWVCVGFLLYFSGNIPFRILRNYYEFLTDATLLTLVNLILGITMYLSFIIGFIWSHKK